MDDYSPADVQEALLEAMRQGAQEATVDAIEAVAEAVGVSKVHGLALLEFFHAAASERTSTAIAGIADYDQQLARLVKHQWDGIRMGRNERAVSR